MTAPDANPTGEDLIARLQKHATAQGKSLQAVARDLSSDPSKWLRQLRYAASPKPHTIARIDALIAGRSVAPPPANSLQAVPGYRARPAQAVARGPVIEPDRPRVDRDPCPRCAVRRDIGCAHTTRHLVAGYSGRGAAA